MPYQTTDGPKNVERETTTPALRSVTRSVRTVGDDERMPNANQAETTGVGPCRFGYVEYDGDQYCFAHGGFRSLYGGRSICHRTRPLPLHRTEAGYPNCSTCDGGGCLDCTDPA